MAYGELKVDSITFTNGGTDTTVSVSGLVQNPTFSGDITVTGTISGSVVQGGTTVSGATVTGTAGEFGTVTGNTAGFTTVTGTTVTGSTANFISGTFTTQVSGATVTGNLAQFTTLTGGTAGFTAVTGTTVTGSAGQFGTVTGNTAGFTTVTGTTVTGTTANFTSGVFTSLSGTTATVTSGVFASGTAAAPSVSVGTTDNGLYSPGTNEVAISTNGTERVEFGTGEVVFNDGGENYDFRIEGDTNSSLFFVDASAEAVGIGTTSPLYRLDVQDVINIRKDGSNLANLQFNGPSTRIQYSDASGNLEFYTNSTKRGHWGYLGGLNVTSGGLALSGGSITFSGADRSIINNDANALAFGTNASERMRIDSSGRLLVGTSSASSNKNSVTPTVVVSASGVSGAAQITRHTTVGGGGGLLELSSTRGTSNTDYTILQSGDGIGTVDFLGADGNEFVVAASIAAQVDGTPGDDDMPGRLVFSTTADSASSPTERMRIKSDGYIEFATANLRLGGGNASTIFRSGTGSGLHFTNNASLPADETGSISDNTEAFGSASYRWTVIYAATGTINTSDANEKQDIQNLSDAELAVARELKNLFKTFRWKEAVAEKGDNARIHVGVIAQDVQQLFAEHGLDVTRYGLWCSDTWYEVDGMGISSDGTPYTADSEGAVLKTRLGIRYEELLSFVLAAL